MNIAIKIPDRVMREDADMQRWAEAIQLLANRMAMSHDKYGVMRNKYPHSASAVASGQKRIDKYHESGNTEDCLDAANFLIIEYLLPTHEEAHFRAQTSAESPGLVWRE